MVLSGLLPGSGKPGADGYCLLESKSQIGEVVQSMGSAWVSFHMKGLLP